MADKRAGDNAGAAAIILADPERHGGEESLAVRWARLWVKRASDDKPDMAVMARDWPLAATKWGLR